PPEGPRRVAPLGAAGETRAERGIVAVAAGDGRRLAIARPCDAALALDEESLAAVVLGPRLAGVPGVPDEIILGAEIEVVAPGGVDRLAGHLGDLEGVVAPAPGPGVGPGVSLVGRAVQAAVGG